MQIEKKTSRRTSGGWRLPKWTTHRFRLFFGRGRVPRRRQKRNAGRKSEQINRRRRIPKGRRIEISSDPTQATTTKKKTKRIIESEKTSPAIFMVPFLSFLAKDSSLHLIQRTQVERTLSSLTKPFFFSFSLARCAVVRSRVPGRVKGEPNSQTLVKKNSNCTGRL